MNFLKRKEKTKVVKLKNYKRRAMINRLKRKMLLIFLLVAVLMLILMFAPFMQIRKINCIGNSKVSSEDIIAASNINIGDNIIRTGKKKTIDSIDNIPYIKSVEISKKYPSTLNIKVVECTVYAYIPFGEKFIFVDETGKILEISATKPETVVPIIEGVKVTSSKVNEIVGFENKDQISSYNVLMRTLTSSNFKGMVTKINIADPDNIMFTVNNELDIIVGNTDNINYKINIFADGIYNSPENPRKGTLDLRYGNGFLKQN